MQRASLIRTEDQRGVSILQLVVWIAVAGVLMGGAFLGYHHYQNGAIDKRVKADLQMMAMTLTDYATEFGGYPHSLPAEFLRRVNPDTVMTISTVTNDEGESVPAVYADGVCLEGTSSKRPGVRHVYQSNVGFVTECNGDPIAGIDPSDQVPAPPPTDAPEPPPSGGPVVTPAPEETEGPAEGLAPAVPVVTATQTSPSTVLFQWQPEPDATAYWVSWRCGTNAYVVGVEDTTETEYEVTCDPGQVASTAVRAGNEYGWSAFAYTDYTLTRPANAPTVSIALEQESGEWVASWNAVEGVTEYEVRWRIDGDDWEESTTEGNQAEGMLGYGQRLEVQAGSVTEGHPTAWSEVATATRLPAAPVPNVELNQETGQWTASWEAVSGAAGYKIRTVTNQGTPAEATTTGTSRNGTLAHGSTMTIQIATVGDAGQSAWSDPVTITRVPATPELELTLDQETGDWTATWNAVPTATGYVLNISIDGGEWATVDATETSHVGFIDLGQKVEVQVAAVNEGGQGAWSASKTVARIPTPPEVGIELNQETGAYVITLTHPSPQTVDSYVIRYRVDEGEWSEDANPEALSGTLQPGETIEVQAASINAAGRSEWSESALATLKTDAPVVLLSLDHATGAWTATWDALPGADSYKVTYAIDSGDPVTETTTENSFEGFVEWASTVGVYVVAVNDGGDSEPSETKVLTRQPGTPTLSIELNQETGEYTLSWTEVVGATGGYVLRHRIDDGEWVETPVDGLSLDGVLEKGKKIEAEVAALGSGGQGQWSNLVSEFRTPETPLPSVPVVSVSIDQATGVWTAMWDRPAWASGYEAQYRIDGGEWVAGTVTETSTTGTIEHGQTVEVQVRSTNVTGVSEWSEIKSASRIPAAFTITGEWVASESKYLVQVPRVEGVTGYTSRYRIDGGEWSTDGYPPASDSEGFDIWIDVPAGSTMEVQVSATNLAGQGPWSNTLTYTRAPSSVTVSTALHGPNSVRATWSAAPGATGYYVQYRLNDGSWSGETAYSTSGTSFIVHAGHRDKVDIRVTPYNDQGPGTASSIASRTTGTWDTLSLQAGWGQYSTLWGHASYTRTDDGMVALQGLVTNGEPGTVIATLPEGYRPNSTLIFDTIAGSDTTRVYLYSNGDVRAWGAQGSWTSLNQIQFRPVELDEGGHGWPLTKVTWVDLSPENGYTFYGGTFSTPAIAKDGMGRVHLQGLLTTGNSWANTTTIVTAPDGYRADGYQHLNVRSHAGSNHIGTYMDGRVVSKNVDPGSWISLQTTYHEAGLSGWTDIPTANGWSNYLDDSVNYTDFQWRKDADGMVMLRGLIRGGEVANGTVVGNLPPEARPAVRHLTTVTASNKTARLDIHTDGTIVINSANFPMQTGSWISFDGVSYAAAESPTPHLGSSVTEAPGSIRVSAHQLPAGTTYDWDYRIGSGAWVSLHRGTTTTTTGQLWVGHDKEVSVRVRATNQYGTSDWIEVTRTTPLFWNADLQNGWETYSSTFGTPSFTKTDEGVVKLKGLLSGGTMDYGTVLFTLPPGYRPDYRLIFSAPSVTNTGNVRVDVSTDGQVLQMTNNATAGWIGLDTIQFLAADAPYPELLRTLQNGWENYGGSYAPALNRIDGLGRYHVEAMIKPGSQGGSYNLFWSSAAGRNDRSNIHFARSSNGWASWLSTAANQAETRPSSSYGSWLSIVEIVHPADASSWTQIPRVNGVQAYGLPYTTPEYTKSADGLVSIRGLYKGGNPNGSRVIGTVPAGFRPKQRLIFQPATYAGSGGTVDVPHRIDIYPNGDIVSVAGANTGYFSVAGIHWIAEQ